MLKIMDEKLKQNTIVTLSKEHIEEMIAKLIKDRNHITLYQKTEDLLSCYTDVETKFEKIGGWSEAKALTFCKIYSTNFNSVPSIFTHKNYVGKKMLDKVYQFKKDCIRLHLENEQIKKMECPEF